MSSHSWVKALYESSGMIQEEDKASKIDIAIAWYKQGRCPCCGKSLGEPRGLEYRERSHDLFCHGCKQSWPIEVDLAVLRDDLSLLEPIQADNPSLPAPDLPLQPGPSGQRLVGLSRLASLFQRLLLR